MRFFLLPAIIILLLNFFVDYCLYRIIKEATHRPLWRRVQAITAALLALVIIAVVSMPKRNGSDSSFMVVMWLLYGYITIYVPKYIYLIFWAISRLPRLWKGRPWHWAAWCGAGIGAVAFMTMWWGALINRYNINVERVEVELPQLPAAFEGFTIAQISDLHVGTYGSDTTFVSNLVDSINALHPDLIVFTGDMVNRRADEFKPFISTFRRLHAPYGVYSIMGNHDYGDYSDWPSAQDKEQDVALIKQLETSAGFTMLNNTTHWLTCGTDSLALIGVENIGDPPFHVYGDLNKAYSDLNDGKMKILLSHNPAHWEQDIEDKACNVAFTLAGHTHAMQMELFGLSPAAWRYEKWGGMYSDTKGHKLYVNIGAGAVGMPYRIGATPEITLFTLRK